MRQRGPINSQIQTKNIVNQRIDQKTWPVPKSARTITFLDRPTPGARAATGCTACRITRRSASIGKAEASVLW